LKKLFKHLKVNFQLFKYLITGSINFVTSFLIFYLLHFIIGINYTATFVITWLYGILLTYSINFIWVFKLDEKLQLKNRLVKYFLVYSTSFTFNIVILRVLVECYFINPMYAQLFILPFVMLINFYGFKLWAFNHK